MSMHRYKRPDKSQLQLFFERSTSRNIIVKLQKIKDKENNIKAAKGKMTDNLQRQNNEDEVDS